MRRIAKTIGQRAATKTLPHVHCLLTDKGELKLLHDEDARGYDCKSCFDTGWLGPYGDKVFPDLAVVNCKMCNMDKTNSYKGLSYNGHAIQDLYRGKGLE